MPIKRRGANKSASIFKKHAFFTQSDEMSRDTDILRAINYTEYRWLKATIANTNYELEKDRDILVSLAKQLCVGLYVYRVTQDQFSRSSP